MNLHPRVPRDAPARVLVVSRCASTFGTSKGGADVLAYRHAEILARQGVLVSLVSVDSVQIPNLEAIPVKPHRILPDSRSSGPATSIIYLINEGFRVIQGALAGAKAMRRRHIDIAISNSSLSTILLRILASRVPLIHYVHDGIYAAQPEAGERRSLVRFVVNNLMERVALRLANRVICASDAVAAQAMSVGVSPRKITTIYPVLAGDSAPPVARPAPTAPRPLPVSPFILTVGQQTGRKRFDLLIRALRYLPNPWKLVVVGDGPFQGQYRELIDNEAMGSQVELLTGVSDAERDELYRSAAAFVLASENEGLPVTAAEALSHGCPALVACPTTASMQSLLPDPDVVMIAEMTPEAIGEGIVRILRGQTRTPQERRESIMHWAAIRFPTEEQVYLAYQNIFRSLFPGPPRPN